MNKDNFIKENIVKHLVSIKLPESDAVICADYGLDLFNKTTANSSNPFKDACDIAGAKAMERVVKGFKYKSPVSKSTRRARKPQEAFNF